MNKKILQNPADLKQRIEKKNRKKIEKHAITIFFCGGRKYMKLFSFYCKDFFFAASLPRPTKKKEKMIAAEAVIHNQANNQSWQIERSHRNIFLFFYQKNHSP